ncbi:hypothetical protein SAMN04488074_12960 [Lentzea albidocapillata subsp. violacea]|uniref:Ricin B lectin domain-containing protein n=1 Tax=Lentzea albidocapillata subsp. violacea TaxID=128104 RepID=A0A1G9X709_9PSEU|nr:RICIN domain-containing protein [Lentzea albidocapillata]SDM92518.1 hypothetical protein SAMN04488074_12960 [Lentzea albidocapillata subsp. violacea]
MRTRLRFVAAAALIITGLTAVPAQAETSTFFHNQKTGLYMDDNFQDGLRAFPFNGGVYQKWDPRGWADNTWQLKNRATGRCIDDSIEYGLRAYPCNKSKYQSWYWRIWGDGTYEFKNQQTGRCIDNFGGLTALRCTASETQSWL